MLTLNQQKHNIKDAFSLNEIPTTSKILIINDVLTTGSTTNEYARISKKSKISIINVSTMMGATKWFKFIKKYC